MRHFLSYILRWASTGDYLQMLTFILRAILLSALLPITVNSQTLFQREADFTMEADTHQILSRCKDIVDDNAIRTFCADMNAKLETVLLKAQHKRMIRATMCSGCPAPFVDSIARYTMFLGLSTEDFDNALDMALRSEGRTIIGGNRAIGLLVTDWFGRPDKKVGISLWKVQDAIVMDRRSGLWFIDSRPVVYLTIQCYVRTKAPNSHWTQELLSADEECEVLESKIHKGIIHAGGKIF